MDASAGGGSLEERYAEVRKAVQHDLQLAVSQARQIAPEARKAELPRLRLNVDLWPPVFVAGAVVEYEARRIETLESGQYVLALHAGGVAICRFLEWTYDGAELKVITKLGPSSYTGQVLAARSLVGVVTRVFVGDREVDPGQRSLTDRLSGLLNDFGTTTVRQKVARATRDALATLTAKPEKRYQQATLASLWRELMKEEARRRKEEAQQKPTHEPEEAPLEQASSPEALRRQMGYRTVD